MAETTDSKPTTAPETAAPANDTPKSPTPPPADSTAPTSSSLPQLPTETPAAQSDDALAPADPPTDPKVAQLRALFADTDEVIIEAVLAGNGGNVDQAIQTLLEVNDPDFKPDNPEELSQLELDEQLARELAREDELAQAQHRVNAPQRSASLPPQPEQPIQPVSYKAYVPKSRRTTGGPASPSLGSWAPPADQPRGQQQQQQGQERDELDELSEQFSKFAQQGKTMFGKFMSQAVQKGKEGIAKVDEAIQRSASPSSSQQPPALPPKTDYAAASYAAPTTTASWQMPSPARSGSASYRTESPLPELSEKPSAERSQSPSPAAPTSSSTAPSSSSPAPASSSASASPAKPAFSIPGLLPRQSFSLLDQQPGSKGKDGASSSTVKSPLSAPAGAEELGKEEGGKEKGVEKKHSPGEEKSHYSLGDDDSEDDMEYVKSPFDDD